MRALSTARNVFPLFICQTIPNFSLNTTIQHIINNATGNFCSIASIPNFNDHTLEFHPQTQTKNYLVQRMVVVLDFIHRLKTKNHLVRHHKQHHTKVLLSRIYLQTQKLQLPYQKEKKDDKEYHSKALFNSFYLSSYNLGFHFNTRTTFCSVHVTSSAHRENKFFSFEYLQFRFSSLDSNIRTTPDSVSVFERLYSLLFPMAGFPRPDYAA